jgi:hypothetical protein
MHAGLVLGCIGMHRNHAFSIMPPSYALVSSPFFTYLDALDAYFPDSLTQKSRKSVLCKKKSASAEQTHMAMHPSQLLIFGAMAHEVRKGCPDSAHKALRPKMLIPDCAQGAEKGTTAEGDAEEGATAEGDAEEGDARGLGAVSILARLSRPRGSGGFLRSTSEESAMTDATTLMFQAPKTVEVYLEGGKKAIDGLFGEGYAEANPHLLATFMELCDRDFRFAVKHVHWRGGDDL